MATQVEGYRTPARVIHWLMALAVISTIPVGVMMVQQGLDRGLQNTLFIYHKNIGVLIFAVLLIRLAYRLMNPPPPLPESIPAWQEKIAGLTHVALYFMLFFMTISGYVRVEAGGFPIEMLDALGIGTWVPQSKGLADFAKASHYYGRYVLALLILMHVGAGIYHGLILRDGVFSRIWPLRAR